MMKSMLLCNARLTVSNCFGYSHSNHCSLYLDTHISIGGVVIDLFEPAVSGLINSSLRLGVGE